MRRVGDTPTLRCRSDAFVATICWRTGRKSRVLVDFFIVCLPIRRGSSSRGWRTESGSTGHGARLMPMRKSLVHNQKGDRPACGMRRRIAGCNALRLVRRDFLGEESRLECERLGALVLLAAAGRAGLGEKVLRDHVLP